MDFFRLYLDTTTPALSLIPARYSLLRLLVCVCPILDRFCLNVLRDGVVVSKVAEHMYPGLINLCFGGLMDLSDAPFGPFLPNRRLNCAPETLRVSLPGGLSGRKELKRHVERLRCSKGCRLPALHHVAASVRLETRDNHELGPRVVQRVRLHLSLQHPISRLSSK